MISFSVQCNAMEVLKIFCLFTYSSRGLKNIEIFDREHVHANAVGSKSGFVVALSV